MLDGGRARLGSARIVMVVLQGALLLSATLAAGQLFDCRRDKQHVKEGDTIIKDCQRMVCVRGDFEPDGCEISNACRGRCRATGGAIVFSPPFLVKLPVKIPTKLPPKVPAPLPGPLRGVFPHPPPLPPAPAPSPTPEAKLLQPLPPLQALLPLPPPGLLRPLRPPLPLPLPVLGSCFDKGRPVANGQVIEAPGCRQLSCNNSVLTTRFCEEVPLGCTVAKRARLRPFPDCCPVWSCVGAGVGSLPGAPGVRGSPGVGLVGSGSIGAAAIMGPFEESSCIQGSRLMTSGQTVFGPGCVKYVCTSGVLTTHGCTAKAVSAGCTALPPAIGKPFPDCCTKWRCTG